MDHDSSEIQMPPEFLTRLRSIVPTDVLAKVLDSFAADKPTSFRINTLQAGREQILIDLQQLDITYEPVDWMVDAAGRSIAFTTPPEHRQTLTHSPIIDQGKIYVQNLSSMLAPLILAPQPGEQILDLAAAPGGKTIQIAQMMHNTGILSAVEPIRSRMFKLRANLTRCNVKIAKTYPIDGRSVGRKTPERFDRVLLDAPCSSEARFRLKKPESWANWSLRKIRESSRKQSGLLRAAIHATKPGGRIVYCTCSFAPEENEQIIDKAIKKFGDAITIDPLNLPIDNWQPGLEQFEPKQFNDQVKHCRRILPTCEMDAFFIASIHKTKSTYS